jgi:OOP family OmpA-OmpF porin
VRNPLAWLLLLLLQAAPCGASAQEFYLAGGLGRSNWDMDCGPAGCKRDSNAWRVAAGLRLNRIVALEAFYFDFGRARSSGAGLDGELGGKAAGAEALLGYQFDRVEVAGKIGFASVRSAFRAAPSSFDSSESATHTEVIGGAMFAYRFTPQFALRLDFDIVTVALNSGSFFYSRGADVSTLTLGLQYRF